MSVTELLRWQWEAYPRHRRTRFNLLLHIVVVPLFLMGNVVLVLALFQRSWAVGLGGVIAMTLSVALQDRGHSREPMPPQPFTGAQNALSRILLEQWITFPRFVLSGGWLHALRRVPAA
jgi:hypothetical protein